MLKAILKIGLLCFLLQPVAGQTIAFSSAQKLSKKTPQLRILGKNNEGVIIYKYGRNKNVVEAYNSHLRLRWQKELKTRPSGVIRKFIVYPDKSLMFYLNQDKGDATLYADMLDAKFNSSGKPLVIDTFSSANYDVASVIKVLESQDKSKLVTYLPEYDGERIVSMRLIGLNDRLLPLYNKQLRVPTDQPYAMRNIEVDNSGNVYFLMENKNRGKKRANVTNEFLVLKYDSVSATLTQVPFLLKKKVHGKLWMEVDNVNGQLIIAGLYSEDEEEMARGYFYEALKIEDLSTLTRTYSPFPKETLYQITGKEDFSTKGLYTFQLSDVIMRYDGGLIAIAESQYDDSEDVEVPSFVPAAGPSFRTINVNHYNDLMVISLLPGGKLDWVQILKKKQTSEDDDGFFSSYALATTAEKLHFVYNEEIYQKTNVNEFKVGPTGGVERSYLFNAADENVLLVPRLGKQISASEVVIPSFKRNYIRLVKITW